MAPKQVSVGVQVELQAKASSMKKLYEDVSNLMANIDPGSVLAKSMSKALGKLRDQVSDFESISGKSFISSSDLTSALNLYKRFYRDINRMNESVQGAGFGSFIHEDSVIQALQKIQDELDNVKSAAEQIKTINIGDAFKVSNKDQKNIKNLQQKFSLKADDDTSIEDARVAAMDNLIAKTEEYNKALARQEELSKSQQKIAIQMSQYSNLRKTHLDTKDQRKDYSLGKMYDVIGDMKGNWVTDLYESSFTDLVNSFFQTTKSGQIKFADFGRDRVEALANLLGIDLSKVNQDAATIQQEVLKALSNTNQSRFKSAISSSRAIVDNMAGYQQAKTAFNTLGISDKDYVALQSQFSSQKTELNNLATTIPVLESLKNDAESLQQQINDLYDAVFGNLQKEELDKRRELHKQQKDIQDLSTQPTKQAMPNIVAAAGQDVSGLGENVERHKAEVRAQQEAENFKANLQSSIKHWMGAQQIITLVKQGIRQAYQDIQSLDKAMTNIAVVTDFSVSDLWGKINEYMSIAQQYGVTTQGVYEVSQLYFQQGLGEAETMELTTETLKMARIAGMDYADAADGMTVAIRGFKMEMEDAARVTDVYSKVAAVTASDSQEIIEAMSKTASSAASVGSGFEETTAMLAVMIEATREAPTNIGSAMKSIISRYGEMTKGMTVDTDGEEIAFNKVDTALQSVGVSIKDATGQFREFDDVIYELAGKWETLDSLSQRYVATVFAGNRQQSRFLALMSNYDRLVEVTEDAQNSEDAGLLQYSKTLDSLETKLNNIKTSFQQFYMDIFNGPVIGAGLEFINNLIKGFNKLGKITSIFNIVNIVKGIKQLANIGVNSFSGIGSSITQSIKNGFSQATLIAFQAGKEHKQAYQSGWNDGAAPTTQNQTSVFAGKGKALVNMAVIGGGALSAVGSAWSSKNAIAGSITSGIGNIISGAGSGAIAGASMGSILGPYGAVIGAAVGGIANALGSIPGIVEAFNNRLQEKADQAAEKAKKSNIKRAEAKEKVRGLEDGIKDLEELGKKRFDSDEDMQAWLDANNALFEKFPELAVKFDEAGNSIVSLTSAEAELTAARKAASDAARQAAADEYDKAKTELEAKKNNDLSNVINDKLLQDQMRSGGIDAVRSYLLQSTGIEKNDKAFTWAATTKDFGYNDLIASFVENVQNGILKPKEEYSQSDIFKRMIGFTGTFGMGGWASEEEINSFIQGINTYRKEINAANRYVDATRASKIAAESASVLSGVEEQYEELESANEAIQAQIIKQFSFDEQGKKITGEVDSNKVIEASQELGEEFTELYTSLLNSGKVDEFNELVQKALTGQITESAFTKQLEALNVREAIQKAYLTYVKDNILLTPADFGKALGEKTGNYSALEVFSKEGKELTEQNYKDIINNEVEFFEAQFKAGKITEEQIGSYIEAYTDFIEKLDGNQAWIDIFTSGNLTSLEGIQETENALKEAGWTGELDWAAFISTSVINFTTSYQNLMDNTVSSIEKVSELFDTALGEMDITDAQKIAGVLSKDVSIFDKTYFTRIGESFHATQATIDLLFKEQTEEIEKQIEEYQSALIEELGNIQKHGIASKDAENKELISDAKAGFLEKYQDTADAAITWKQGTTEGFFETTDSLNLDELIAIIEEYYNFMGVQVEEEALTYLENLKAQWLAEFNLTAKGRTAKDSMISEGVAGLGDKVQVGQEELAYALLAKLSQDITSNLDEAEYALFTQFFGEDYLVADGTGGWQIDTSRIDEFIENYQLSFGTFITNLLFNTTTSIEEKLKDLLSDAASFGEDAGRGEVFDENDLRQLLEPILGSLETEIWKQLLISFTSGDWLSFNQTLSEAGKTIDGEAMDGIKTAQGEFIFGASRSADELAKDILQSKYDYISGDLSKADIASMSGVDDGGLKKTLVAQSDKIGDWAKLSVEEKLTAVAEVLKEDESLSELERADELEKRIAELLSKEYGHITSRNDILEESYNIFAETGGKNLTEEQVATLRRAGENLEYFVTADGYQIVNTDAISKTGQDALVKYYDTLSQNAAKGAEELLSAMAEGTLTGAQIQDYFKELDIDIDYATAENLANGTLEGLLESIKTSLADINIDVSDKMDEIMAAVMDAILNSISSGISSLISGLEGTLGAADYQALVKKYKLTGSVHQTSKGLQLDANNQRQLISRMFMEADKAGLSDGFGDQLWEVWRDGQEDTIDGYTAIEEEIARVKAESEKLTDEALAYVEALQQARHAAMFDEDSVEFAFMEQDSVDGLAKSFDKFVDNIDKAKDAISGLKTSKTMGYNDFFNILDTISKSGNWETVAKNMGLAQEFVDDYNHFATSVVSASEEIGKIDAKGLAKVGLDVSTAAKGMAEGMADGLKETAKSQIEYLTGIEKMLLALQALEGIGNIDLSLGISFKSSVDGPVDLTLSNISKYWQEIMDFGDANLNAKIDISIDDKLRELGAAGFNDFFKELGFGENFDFITAFFGKDGFTFGSKTETQLASQFGQFASITKDLTEQQWLTLAQDMQSIFDGKILFDKLGNFAGFDFGEGGLESLVADFQKFLSTYDFGNIKESLNTALNRKFGEMGKEEITLKTSGLKLKLEDDGSFSFDGLLTDKNKESVMADLSEWLGQTVTDITVGKDGKVNVFGENGIIDTSGTEKLNTDFQTAAEAASTLQTAITQISTVASTFQVSSGFQSLADQLNAAAEAAGKLISALGSNGETALPDTSAIEAELAAALAIYESMGRDMTHGIIPMNYDELDAAQDRVIELQGQLDALKAPSSIATGLIAELGSAVEIANQLSNALANNNGTPLEVNFNVDEANDNVTVLIANLLQLNAVFKPTIEIEDKASSVLESIIQLIANISSKTVTITTVHKDVYATVSSSGNGSISDKGGKDDGGPGPFAGTMNGLAFADGSLGRLHSGAVLANKALVGELGPELAVYDGQYHMLGANGAEFVDLPSDAIIFNHLQTQGILRGQMNIRGTAMAEGNVSGPAFAGGGISAALSAVRRAKSVWQGLLNSLSAADLMKGGGGGGGGGDESLKAHIADLQEWYNLSRQIADIEGQINVLLAKRKNLTDGHEYLRNLRETQRLLDDQVNTQQDLLRFQELQLQRQAEHINNNKIWSQFLEVDENGLLRYKKGNETNGGKGALEVLSQMNEMSGEEQLAFVQSLGWSYTNTDGEELENEELVAKFYEELQKQIDDYDALRDTVQETESTLADLEEQINEIEREIRDNEIDLSKEIYDIIVDAWEENIKNLKEQNDLIKEANEAYANGIQEALDAERQQYEQNQAIADREQLQRQLSLLRRSGGSASEIADLEQQLDDMLQDEYFTNQENTIETIRDTNQRQAELLDQQVKLQEDALEYEKENGVIWSKVYEIMQGTDAEILNFMQGKNTEFFTKSYLQQEDMLTEWSKKIGIYTEERQRQNYTSEAIKSFNSIWETEQNQSLKEGFNKADTEQQEAWKREYNDTYSTKRLEGRTHEEALALAQKELYEHIQNWLKAEEDKKKQTNSFNNSNDNNSNGSNSEQHETRTVWQAYGKKNSEGQRKWGPTNTNSREGARQGFKNQYGFWPEGVDKRIEEYAKGGIINKTGLVWVDGSKSKPERILSAEQNKILEEGLAMVAGRGETLKEAFNSFASNLGSSVRAAVSNITKNTDNSNFTIAPGAVQLQISQLNDKYDVDDLFDDIADRLYSIAAKASGRGVSRR